MKLLDEVNADFTALDDYGWTVLHTVASKGHPKIVEWLLEKKKVKLHAVDQDNWTALHCACMSGHVEVVKVLLAKGSMIEAAASNGSTAVYVASAKGHAAVVQCLLQHKAKIEVLVGKDELSPLNIASTKNFPEVVKLLVANGASIESRDKNGLTILHRCSAKGLTGEIMIFSSYAICTLLGLLLFFT